MTSGDKWGKALVGGRSFNGHYDFTVYKVPRDNNDTLTVPNDTTGSKLIQRKRAWERDTEKIGVLPVSPQ